MLQEDVLARRIATLAQDEKALDVSILDIRKLTVLADYFVIASGRSLLQVRNLADTIVNTISEEADLRPLRQEGLAEGKWVVLDYGTIIIHLFRQEEREFYQLENLWGDALPLLV
ncbi:MAG: ribosome silencing factor [Methanomassiliicoccales archaeon]